MPPSWGSRPWCAPWMPYKPPNRARITETGLDIHRYICSDLVRRPPRLRRGLNPLLQAGALIGGL
jgi:hypothetical protein